MKRLLFVLAMIPFVTQCTTDTDEVNLVDGDKNTLTVTVEYSEKIMDKIITAADDGSTVYLFDKFEARDLAGGKFVNRYDYLGQGVFEHKETKERISYNIKATVNSMGKAVLNNVPQATHTIASDSKKTGKTSWITINTKTSNAHKFTFEK